MLPSDLDQPAYLMCPPLSYTDLTPNNIWMRELPEHERQPDPDRAMAQWMDLYSWLAAQGVVYLLPTPRRPHLQDLVFTANNGAVLQHGGHTNTYVASDFTSPPRAGESAVGAAFLNYLGYDTYQPDGKFEGEADLKFIRGNVYIGGHGQRTQRRTLQWMAAKFDMRIIPIHLTDERLYHLDCVVCPVTTQHTITCTSMLTTQERDRLAEHTGILDVTTASALAGATNTIRCHHTLLSTTDIHDLDAGTDDYHQERGKIRELEAIADKVGLELALFNLSEFARAGALLSCLVLHLNHWSRTADPA